MNKDTVLDLMAKRLGGKGHNDQNRPLRFADVMHALIALRAPSANCTRPSLHGTEKRGFCRPPGVGRHYHHFHSTNNALTRSIVGTDGARRS